MCVFPAASGQFLPPTWHKLMQEPDSPIIDMYPTDFALDMNGKKYEWMGVVLLPFLDEERLHRALAGVYRDMGHFFLDYTLISVNFYNSISVGILMKNSSKQLSTLDLNSENRVN